MNDTAIILTSVDTIVNCFVKKISNINSKFVEGIYLTGSISLNDFYLNKSDIDFLVLCKNLPGKEIVTQLTRIHREIEKRYNTPELSGVYISSESIQSETPEDIKALHYHKGTMRYGIFEMAPVTLTELKHNAITVFGGKPEELSIDVKENYLYKFLHGNINSYWSKWIKQHSTYLNRKILLLLFPRLTEWSVLGVARQLCTLQTGKIVSKTDAGLYCLKNLPESFHPIIEDAIDIRKDNRIYPFLRSFAIKPSFRRLSQTIECVNYIIQLFNKIYDKNVNMKNN